MPTLLSIPWALSPSRCARLPDRACAKTVFVTTAPSRCTGTSSASSGPKQPEAGITGFASRRSPSRTDRSTGRAGAVTPPAAPSTRPDIVETSFQRGSGRACTLLGALSSVPERLEDAGHVGLPVEPHEPVPQQRAGLTGEGEEL